MEATPQVWVGCLAAYNCGALHGKWVDATDAEVMQETADDVVKTSPAWKMNGHAEETFIADYDGFPASVVRELGEYPDYKTVAKVASAIEEHGEPFKAWLESLDYGSMADGDLGERFQESYRGEWDSEESYAEDYVSDCGWGGVCPIPDSLIGGEIKRI